MLYIRLDLNAAKAAAVWGENEKYWNVTFDRILLPTYSYHMDPYYVQRVLRNSHAKSSRDVEVGPLLLFFCAVRLTPRCFSAQTDTTDRWFWIQQYAISGVAGPHLQHLYTPRRRCWACNFDIIHMIRLVWSTLHFHTRCFSGCCACVRACFLQRMELHIYDMITIYTQRFGASNKTESSSWDTCQSRRLIVPRAFPQN